jgi:FlaA1/EpsC-like NDP-sugar epimerase
MRKLRIFVTGFTGTLGTVVVRNLLAADFRVVGYSRDEQKQRAVPEHENLTKYLGDVRDRDRLLEATRNVDLILHFAALKCVDSLEANPEESVETNIEGTRNVLYAERVNGIARVCFVSTDKAAYPVNVYGASKLIAERLVLRNPKNVVCRYGNVVGSRGSVVPEFIRRLKAGEEIKITDPRMTRFWIRIEDAANFVVNTALDERKTGLRFPAMGASKIIALASAIAEELGVSEYSSNIVGSRPGEKTHECLATEFETEEKWSIFSDSAPQFSKESLRELVRPLVEAAR